MAIKDIGALASEQYLQSRDVDALIRDLESARPAQWEDADSYEADMGTLAELKVFREEVSGQTGNDRWLSGMTLVRDSAWEEFAEDEAESLFGKPVMDSGYFPLDKFALDLQTDYQDARLSGVTFWYRS